MGGTPLLLWVIQSEADRRQARWRGGRRWVQCPFVAFCVSLCPLSVHPLHCLPWFCKVLCGQGSLSLLTCCNFCFLHLYLVFFIIFFFCVCAKSFQLCLTPSDSMGCNLPGPSIHGVLWARILEWVAIPSFRGSS